MKIKYYLRGLGTGIVVTAILMALVAGGNKTMTDEEIKSRAARLGMVAADHTLRGNAQESQESIETQESRESIETQESQESIETQESQESMETQESQESMETQESQESVETQESKESMETQESQESIETQESQESVENQESQESSESVEVPETSMTNDGGVIIITIYRGNSSNVVAKYLADAGLVESASQYDAYLCRNGYDKCICVGDFEIPMGSTEEEIAKIITKGN